MEKELFEEMWKLSIQKFEAKHGPLTETDNAEYGKPFMYEAWQETVVPKLTNLTEALEAIDDHGRALSFIEVLKERDAKIKQLQTELGQESECICGDPDCCR